MEADWRVLEAALREIGGEESDCWRGLQQTNCVMICNKGWASGFAAIEAGGV
jgi:hypothetical protein